MASKASNAESFKWVVGKKTNLLVEKQDLLYVAVLTTIALVIGVYLIATTVLISKDGVSFIERAQQLANDPIQLIKTYPPGYPFLILTAHKTITLFSKYDLAFTWIYSAQTVTLLFRLLTLIALYLLGRLLVGSKNSFLAILILIFLPFPTRIVCDIVREWPYLLFLTTGLLLLSLGTKYGNWWVFGIVGLTSGLGYLIRYESIQLVVYGFLWSALSLLRPKLWNISRGKISAALILLFIGFAVPVVPYMKCADRITPPKIKTIMKSFSYNLLPEASEEKQINSFNMGSYAAEIISPNIVKAVSEVFKTIGESLMWFFLPALIIGLSYRFRYSTNFEEVFLMTAFISVNVMMMLIRYCYIELHISQRWSLPLIVITIFYVPLGLQIIGNWLDSKFPINWQRNNKKFSWFLILFLIGIGICTPKLFRPIRADKQDYREAANWLRENTSPEDIISVPDKRISFYATGKFPIYENRYVPGLAANIVSKLAEQIELTSGSINKPAAAAYLVLVPKIEQISSQGAERNIDNLTNKYDAFLSGLAMYVSLKNLIAYWPANDTQDHSIYGNNVELRGKAASATGKYGQAFDLTNGPGDYIECRNKAILNPASFITLSAWIYPVTASKGSIITKNGPYSMEFCDDCKIRVGIHTDPPSWTFAKSHSALSLNTWHHVAMTYDGSYIRIYINGEMSGRAEPKSGEMTMTRTGVFIGYGIPGFDNYFNGLIDEIMIFQEALSPDKVKQLYEMVESQMMPTLTKSTDYSVIFDCWRIEKMYPLCANENKKPHTIAIYRME